MLFMLCEYSQSSLMRSPEWALISKNPFFLDDGSLKITVQVAAPVGRLTGHLVDYKGLLDLKSL